jgi:hypothetical protein
MRKHGSRVLSAIALSLGLSLSAFAASLNDIQQNPDPAFFEELSARLGCEQAAQWVAQPAGGAGEFLATLTTMKDEAKKRSGREDRARSWYALIKQNFFNSKKTAEQCSPSNGRTTNDGLSALLSKFPEGLVVVGLGGFGSHTASEGTLTTSFETWNKTHQPAIATGKLKFMRVECSFSYSPDESFCAADMLKTIESALATQDPSGKMRLLLWGYSKGGISAVEMLRTTPWLRDRTAAVVSVGTPFQGSALIDRMAVAVDKFVANSQIPGTPDAMGADTIMKLIQMWIGGARADVDDIMKNFAKVREGVHSLTTKSRAVSLSRNLTTGAFLRSNGSKIPVYQIAGILDPSRMVGIPLMSVKGGKLVAVDRSYDVLHAAQLTAMMSSVTKPLSDSCVALEDALLPLGPARAAGLDPHFLTVLRLDHLGLRFHRLPNELKHGAPDHALVDAALATIARRSTP